MGIKNLLNAIQSDVSNGEINPSPRKVISSSFYDPPVKVRTIDDEMERYATTDWLSFPADRPKYYFHLGIREYKRTSLMSVGQVTPYAHIYLPLPKQITGSQTVAWGEVEIGMGVGGLLNAGGEVYTKLNDEVQKSEDGSWINTLRSLDTEKQNELLKMIGVPAAVGIAGVISQFSTYKNKVLGALAKMGISAATAYLGVSPNQFVTILMKGPQYRRVQLNWRLLPRNQTESLAIKNIVKTLNNAMAPGTASNGLIFTYPDIFYCDFMPNSGYLYKFKPAALKNFVANFTPGGIPAFYRNDGGDGQNAPEAVDLSMEFIELEYWLKGDFIDDNNPRNVYGS